MTLTELSYIVALAQEQHFGRAAERCNVSQPTLSIAIKKLEEELDVTLFERGRNGIQITPLGERIVAMAGGVLNQTAAIKDVAAADKDQLQGPLGLPASEEAIAKIYRPPIVSARERRLSCCAFAT